VRKAARSSRPISGGSVARRAGLFAILAFVLAFCGPLETAQRFVSIQTLSKEELVREARAHIDDRAGGHQMACLYAVSCEGNRARLAVVSDLASWDLEATREDIWRRRFDGRYCPGRTANFGLHLSPAPGADEQTYGTSHARWSFARDRFIPIGGRFQSGSFSEEPWERCTPENAIAFGADFQ
jgi:hypothetical protein